jgi:hypothetical protein
MNGIYLFTFFTLFTLLTLCFARIQINPQPITIHTGVENFVVFQRSIIVSSDSSVLNYTLSGYLMGNLTFPDNVKVYTTAVISPNRLAILCSNNLIYLTKDGFVMNTISINSNYYGVWWNNFSREIISLEYPFVPKYSTIMHFFNYDGVEVDNITIPFMVQDLFISKDRIFIDNNNIDETSTYITILNSSGVEKEINTTKYYQPSGLFVHNKIIYAGGIGLDIWNLYGTKVHHYCGDEWVYYPKMLDLRYIVYLEVLGKEKSSPFIRIINSSGDRIHSFNVTEPMNVLRRDSLQVTENSDIVLSINYQTIQIWRNS